MFSSVLTRLASLDHARPLWSLLVSSTCLAALDYMVLLLKHGELWTPEDVCSCLALSPWLVPPLILFARGTWPPSPSFCIPPPPPHAVLLPLCTHHYLKPPYWRACLLLSCLTLSPLKSVSSMRTGTLPVLFSAVAPEPQTWLSI